MSAKESKKPPWHLFSDLYSKTPTTLNSVPAICMTILRSKWCSKYLLPIPCFQQSEPKSIYFINFYFLFAMMLQKILNFPLLPLKWIINLAPNLDWRKCKIFLGSNFLLIARFLFVLSCISPKKRHPKEPVVPDEKYFNLSQIYSLPYLPKVFIDSRLSGRLTPAVSGRKRPF